MRKLILLLLPLALLLPNALQAQLFSEDFGTSFASLSTTKWPTSCRGGGASSYNSSSGPCAGTSDRSYYIYNGGYIGTQSLSIPAGGASLTFNYSYSSFSNYPSVRVSTSGCLWHIHDSSDVNYGSTCGSPTVDLSAYAGQTIVVRFQSGSSFKSFYIDDVEVTGSGGGGGGGSCTTVFEDDFPDDSPPIGLVLPFKHFWF